MTVTYTHEVADCQGFGNFWRLLFRWKGSVYKLMWMDLLAYCALYTLCSLVYRLALNDEQKSMFESVALYCHTFSDLIPVSFVLGFYVSIVIQRWWSQYMYLPWPDSLALFVSTSIHGHDRQGRLMRRTIMRYVNLSFVLTLVMITPRAKKRFPTIDHLVDAGFMTENEKKIYEGLMEKTSNPIYYVPLVWAGTLVSRARKEGRIRDDFAVKTIMDQLNTLRGNLGGLLSYDWISIPLVYTQVVTLAVYTFFLSTIMGRQFLDTTKKYPDNHLDCYVPIFTLLQFFFYMGWLKVAESLVNPFGEDDDDFEVNWLIDRNLQVSYMIVDEMHNEHPELTQDMYWDEVFPTELPYTIASEHFRREAPMGSTANIQIPEAEQEFLPVLDEEPEEEEDSKMSGDIKRLNSNRSFGSSAISGRKSPFLSMLQHRILRRNSIRSNDGSHTSLRKSRPRSMYRSASRTSAGSHNSLSNVKRNNTTVSFQDSEIFHMSQESLANSPGHDPHSQSHFQRTSLAPIEDDGAILIKIKRRDRNESEAGTSGDSVWPGPHKSTPYDDTQSAIVGGELPGDTTDLSEVKSDGSRCSILTSIFHDSPPSSSSDQPDNSQQEQPKETSTTDDSNVPGITVSQTKE